jgi:hypothetical protein
MTVASKQIPLDLPTNRGSSAPGALLLQLTSRIRERKQARNINPKDTKNTNDFTKKNFEFRALVWQEATPVVNALAVVIIAATVFCWVLLEWVGRAKEKKRILFWSHEGVPFARQKHQRVIIVFYNIQQKKQKFFASFFKKEVLASRPAPPACRRGIPTLFSW